MIDLDAIRARWASRLGIWAHHPGIWATGNITNQDARDVHDLIGEVERLRPAPGAPSREQVREVIQTLIEALAIIGDRHSGDSAAKKAFIANEALRRLPKRYLP